MYADFLDHCDSACFAEWTQGVLGDAEVQAWLATLPDGKAQPNLVFAAARWHGVPAPGPYAGLRDALLGDDAAGGAVRRTILARATQTNEVGRLATLVPAFAGLAERPAVVRWRCSRSAPAPACASTPTAGATPGRPTTARSPPAAPAVASRSSAAGCAARRRCRPPLPRWPGAAASTCTRST